MSPLPAHVRIVEADGSPRKKADGSPMYPAPGLDAFLKARKLTRDGSTQTSVPDRPRPHIHAELVEG